MSMYFCSIQQLSGNVSVPFGLWYILPSRQSMRSGELNVSLYSRYRLVQLNPSLELVGGLTLSHSQTSQGHETPEHRRRGVQLGCVALQNDVHQETRQRRYSVLNVDRCVLSTASTFVILYIISGIDCGLS